MKKSLFILALVAFVAAFAFGCDDDSSSGCKDYCDKLKECDESGTITDEQTDLCKQACDAADEAGTAVINDEYASCAGEDTCDAFYSCLAGDTADGDTEDGDTTDGDDTTEE